MYYIYHRLTNVLVAKIRKHEGASAILQEYSPLQYEVVIY
jgi:hypothetical protein